MNMWQCGPELVASLKCHPFPFPNEYVATWPRGCNKKLEWNEYVAMWPRIVAVCYDCCLNKTWIEHSIRTDKHEKDVPCKMGFGLLIVLYKHGVTAQYHRTISKRLSNKQYKGNNYLHVPGNQDVNF